MHKCFSFSWDFLPKDSTVQRKKLQKRKWRFRVKHWLIFEIINNVIFREILNRYYSFLNISSVSKIKNNIVVVKFLLIFFLQNSCPSVLSNTEHVRSGRHKTFKKPYVSTKPSVYHLLFYIIFPFLLRWWSCQNFQNLQTNGAIKVQRFRESLKFWTTKNVCSGSWLYSVLPAPFRGINNN